MTKAEEDYLRSIGQPQSTGEPLQDAIGTVDQMDQRLANLQGLNFQDQYNAALASGINPIPGYQAPQTSPVEASQPSGIGLGLSNAFSSLGQGLSSGLDAITPTQDTLHRIFMGLEAGGSTGTPLYLQERQLHEQALQRRNAVLQQQQQLEEQKRQHDLQLFERAIANPRASQMMEALGNDPNYRYATQAKMFGKAMKDSDYSSFEAYKKYIPDEVQQRFIEGKLPYHELTSYLDQAREMSKLDAKEEAKAKALKTAMDTPAEQRTASQAQMVEEHVAKTDLQRAQTELALANAEKARREAQMGPPDHSVLNRVHQSLTGGKPFEQGDAQTQEAALKKYSQMQAEGRTNVMLATPAPVEKRTNLIKRSEFLKSGALVMPPAGASEGALRSGDYIEMTDKQKDAWGEVVNSGTTLNTLFDMIDPLITAKTPAQALKQYGRLSIGAVSKKIPAATTFLADSEAFSSRMARVFGSEVGVLTNPDVTRWQRALPTFGDTVQVKDMKKKVFMEIYNQTRTMTIKKLAGEDITKDLEKLRQGPLAQAEKLNPPSIDEDFNTLFGGAK